YLFLFFFFFQAEDGIRDGHVTGVQTCALPISFQTALSCSGVSLFTGCAASNRIALPTASSISGHQSLISPDLYTNGRIAPWRSEIGRASCRERVEMSVVAGELEGKREHGVSAE